MAWEYSSSSNFDFLSTTLPEGDQEDNTEERNSMPSTVNNHSGLDAAHQEREVSSTVINNCTCGTDHDPEKNTDEELTLIENAFEYLTKKYPPGCSMNYKRIIRRKAEGFEEQNGEIIYQKRGGSMVSRYNVMHKSIHQVASYFILLFV